MDPGFKVWLPTLNVIEPLIGYTEEEIKNYFSYYLNEAKLQLELDEDEIVDQLRKNYDGFSFDQEAATHVFCPWSVLNFFKEGVSKCQFLGSSEITGQTIPIGK